jgi:hypothetical protein
MKSVAVFSITIYSPYTSQYNGSFHRSPQRQVVFDCRCNVASVQVYACAGP